MEELAFKNPTEKSLEEDSKSEMPKLKKIGDFYLYKKPDIKYAIYRSSTKAGFSGNIQELDQIRKGVWSCVLTATFPKKLSRKKILKILLEVKKNQDVGIIEENGGKITRLSHS